MANRYWVGGTGAWNGTNTTNWSASSGGAGGASVPTTSDAVFFDSNSGVGTVTISTGNLGAQLINCATFTGTLAGSANITVAGAIALVAGMTFSYTGTFTITGTGSLQTSGKTIANINITAPGGTVTLADALTLSGTLNINSGTFTTSASNYSVTASRLTTGGSTTRGIILNGSTVTLSGSSRGSAAFYVASATALTFNAGTSTIILTASVAALTGESSTASLTFSNVTFNNTSAASTVYITGSNTYNTLTINPPTADGSKTVYWIGTNQTITTLVAAGGSAVRRIRFTSNFSSPSQITLTVGTYTTKSDIDFQDIRAAGTSSPWSGTRIGDAGYNTSITGATPKTVYWNLAGTNNSSAVGWALSSGGAPSVNNFPLAQDTIVINDSSAGSSITFASDFYIGNLTTASRTASITLSLGGNVEVLGDFTLSSAISFSSGGTTFFSERSGTQTLTSAGKTWNTISIFKRSSGTLLLADALTLSGSLINSSVDAPIFDAASYNVTASSVDLSNAVVNMGSGLWTLSNVSQPWIVNASTTLNKQTADILLSSTSTTPRTFAGGGKTYNKLTIGGATGISTLTITGANTFSEIASTKTVAHTIVFPNATTTVGDFTVTGSAGNVVTLSSSSGTFTLTKTGVGIISSNYLSISNSTATPASTWYAGPNSTDGGGNTGWIFASPSTGSNNFFVFFLP